MSEEHYWINADRGRPKYSEINLPQYRFFRHESHIEYPGIEFRVPS
jgi:hypothetical protein